MQEQRNLDRTKLLKAFKSGKYTPKQLGSLFRQYSEKYICASAITVSIEMLNKFDGGLGL